MLVSLVSGEKRRLTSQSKDLDAPARDLWPAVSPDGTQVAFIRDTGASKTLFKISLSPEPGPAGTAKALTTPSGLGVGNPVWSNDGRAVLFTQWEGDAEMWRIDSEGESPPEALHIQGRYASLARGRRRMVFQRDQRRADIWEVQLAAPGQPSGKPRRLLASSYPDSHPEFSPDGSRIVFTSMRSGASELWIADADGSHPMQLTRLGGPQTGTARWSPDGTPNPVQFDGREQQGGVSDRPQRRRAKESHQPSRYRRHGRMGG